MSKTRHLLWNGVGGASLVPSEVFEISLKGESAAAVRKAISSGKYSSADEVVADALSVWQRELDEEDVSYLKAAWNEAVHDTRPRVAPGPVFDAVRARLIARLNEQDRS